MNRLSGIEQNLELMTDPIEKSEFAIHNRMEIVFTLNDLAKGRTAINLSTADGVNLLTTILKVSSENNHVLVDPSRDERINEKIANSKRVTFQTNTGVKVRWQASGMNLIALRDGDAFSFPVPSVIERVQRRQHFRLNTPQGSHALVCRIPLLTDEEDDDEEDPEVLEANILDMSAGGICISVKGDLPPHFSQGLELSGCSFELPDIGRIPIGLRICRAWHVKTHSGEEIHKIGMEFINLSRGASNVIQRYMVELEKNQLAVSG